MSGRKIWYLIKLFEKESYADQFMSGLLYLNTLAYFRKRESECDDGRVDSAEAVAMWWQPNDIILTLKVPKLAIEIAITEKDLAAPVSVSFNRHDFLHLLCLYAVYWTGFEPVGGKIHCDPKEAEALQRQLRIDDRCFKFGEFAVIVPVVPFLDRLKKTLRHKATGRLVEYYDDEIFHGEIPEKDIPFRKQKRFSYQREFRLCFDTGAVQDSPITISIGDISDICAKVPSAKLPDIFTLKPEQASQT